VFLGLRRVSLALGKAPVSGSGDRDGMVGAAGRAASTNHRQPPLQMLIVVVNVILLVTKYFFYSQAKILIVSLLTLPVYFLK